MNKTTHSETPEERAVLTSRILEAFKNEDDGWRTIGGVARDTGLPVELVREHLQNAPDVFEVGPIAPSGTALYTLKPHKVVGETITFGNRAFRIGTAPIGGKAGYIGGETKRFLELTARSRHTKVGLQGEDKDETHTRATHEE